MRARIYVHRQYTNNLVSNPDSDLDSDGPPPPPEFSLLWFQNIFFSICTQDSARTSHIHAQYLQIYLKNSYRHIYVKRED